MTIKIEVGNLDYLVVNAYATLNNRISINKLYCLCGNSAKTTINNVSDWNSNMKLDVNKKGIIDKSQW